MDKLALESMARTLRRTQGFRGKDHIKPVSEIFNDMARRFGIPNGDDAAFIPDGDGYLLFAAEGIAESLANGNPTLAGRSAVLANVNDIYAMGGKPIALVDVVAAPDEETTVAICKGMRDNAVRFNVPVVGGHTVRTSGGVFVGMAVLGRARNLITSFDARPGHNLVLISNDDGVWLDSYGFWNCTPESDDDKLTPRLELLRRVADDRLAPAGKDVSMAGIAGTAMMLAESSGVGVRIDLDAVTPPTNVPLERWLAAFMSYGFVLAVADEKLEEVRRLFGTEGLTATVIGSFIEERRALLHSQGETVALWDFTRTPFVGEPS